MRLAFMSQEDLRKALGDINGYEILDSLPLPESFEDLEIDEEAIAKAKREESK